MTPATDVRARWSWARADRWRSRTCRSRGRSSRPCTWGSAEPAGRHRGLAEREDVLRAIRVAPVEVLGARSGAVEVRIAVDVIEEGGADVVGEVEEEGARQAAHDYLGGAERFGAPVGRRAVRLERGHQAAALAVGEGAEADVGGGVAGDRGLVEAVEDVLAVLVVRRDLLVAAAGGERAGGRGQNASMARAPSAAIAATMTPRTPGELAVESRWASTNRASALILWLPFAFEQLPCPTGGRTRARS